MRPPCLTARTAAIAVALLLLASGASAAPAADAAAQRRAAAERLLKGDRKGALEAARAALGVDPNDVEAHVLYQDASRGEIAPAILLADYRARAAKSPGPESGFLVSRLLPPGEAEKVLRERLAADPKAYWAQVGLAAVLTRSGKGGDAEAAALAALALREGDADAAGRAGGQCAEAHRFPAAEACYRKAAAAAPKATEHRVGLAHALLRQGKLDEAKATADALVREAPQDRVVLGLAAAVFRERGALAEAEAAYQRLLAADPADMDALLHLSTTRARRVVLEAEAASKELKPEALDPALRDLRKVVKALPERADAQVALGFVAETASKADEALAAYREAARLDPLGPDAFSAAGGILLAKGLIDDGLKEYRKALDRDPKNAEALFGIGHAFDMQGKVKEATDAFQALLKAYPDHARGWHALGLDQDAAGRPAEAVASLKRAADLDPKVGAFLRDLGEIYFAQKKYDSGAAAHEAAVKIDPKDVAAWGGLARCRSQMKKWEEAAAAYEKCAELDAEEPDYRLALGIICQEYLKQYQKALDAYAKYLALGGDAPAVEKWVQDCQAEVAKTKK